MCFSAPISFSAAVLLAASAGVNLRRLTAPSQWLLAIIPLLFALQQFSEGILWLTYSSDHPFLWMQTGAIYLFLFIALVLWPTWIPLSLYIIETQPTRKILLMLLLLGGMGLSLVNIYYCLWLNPDVAIVNKSVRYAGEMPEERLVYALIVILPCLISSLNKIWVFGLLIAAAGIAAYYFFAINYVSVWCFLAAVGSLWIYQVFRDLSSTEAHLP